MEDRISLRWLWVLAFALSILTCFVRAEAGTITTTVKAPSLFTDGTKIDAPIKYRLEGNYEGQPAIVVTSDSPTFVLQSMPAGRWCNRVYAVVNNVDADPSSDACVTVPAPNTTPPPTLKKPNPAYGITTTATP